MSLSDRLSDYADRSTELLADSPQMDEENTKRKLIEPLLGLLGWDVLSSDIELEYSVPMGAGTKKVDYALKLKGTPVVFVEAKGADTTLSEKHENQLRSYMRQVGVDWGILSNGRKFEIFRREQSATRPNEISLAKFSLDEIAEYQHPLRTVSRESIETGEAGDIADEIERMRDAITALRENKEGIAERVTAVVTDVAGDSISQRAEDEAKRFVDELAASLGEQTHDDSGGADPERDGPRFAEEQTEYGIAILDSGTTIEEIYGPTQTETMGNAVDYLIREHGLSEKVELPYKPGRGQGYRATLNSAPKHTDGSEMAMYEELSGGIYLFTGINSDTKYRHTQELAQKVNLDVEFTRGW